MPLMAIFLWCCVSNLYAQRINLVKDFPFFEAKSAEYQRWLDTIGLGKSIVVDQVGMRPILDEKKRRIGIDSTELELILCLRATDPDTAIGIWQSLKRNFDTSGDSLEAYLYRNFVHKMEIPGVQGSIQVYIRNKHGDIDKCFYLYIWEEPDALFGHRIASEYHFMECRSKSFELDIKTPKVKTAGKGKRQTYKTLKPKTAGQVFDIIDAYIKTEVINHPRYKDECNDRYPSFDVDSNRTELSYGFTLKDLCKEVLTDQTRSDWERFWNYNTIAMERLTFQFKYTATKDGFTLTCTIDGKYGSGFFKPRTEGYMNMETDFNDFFETYKNRLRLALGQRLQ
jgi:hypothetical protein